ncbi:chemotaxis protein CheC [Cytobacillus sp. IB215316]|uniref:chemotaxis protein CheC n=1 Tax=Cytobacillus sp. IB215316 TaxID=3097354 RepID=UPI002A0F74F7|nr:chemotaxis protein CheC [Cytobacillus sp. IB215316]MDX8362230.1 chemotaxis protein CheC [Cytobacillus sp. IB215316]
MTFIERFNHTHLDILKEIGNIGAGHSATALSKILNKKIEMNIPEVKIVSFDEMMDLAGGADNVVVSVFLQIEGDAPGSMFLLLPLEQASLLVQQWTGLSNFAFEGPPYDQLAMSALEELGNILSSSYLSSLSDFTKLNMYPSVPQISVDLVGAIISMGLIQLSQVSDYATVIDTSVIESDQSILEGVKGHIFLLPDPNSFTKLFQALGVTGHE